MSNKKFSILTASYNCGRYLSTWRNSISNQSYRPLEVILVDDYSTDTAVTRSAVKKARKLFDSAGIEFRIKRNAKRRFCSNSYEIARRMATGYYFGVLDSDDALVPDAVDYVVELYERFPDVAYIYTQFEICNIQMMPMKKGMSEHPGKFKTLLGLGEHSRHGFSHWRTFSSRLPKVERLFAKKLRCAVDKYLGYRLEELGKGLFTNKICYRYRQRLGYSLTTSGIATKKQWAKVIRQAKERRKKFNLVSYPIMNYKEKHD